MASAITISGEGGGRVHPGNPPVAQVSNLLYREASSLRLGNLAERVRKRLRRRLEIGDTAGWKPALPKLAPRTSSYLPLLLLTLCCAGLAAASGPADWRASALQQYFEAQGTYTNRQNDATVAWGFGRACFDLAEYATNRAERAALAAHGIAACRLAVARQSNSAAAHFYLAMNLGQLARTKTLGALSLVDEMETEFLRASQLDPLFWYAGPDRNVGQLYRDAPAIGSVGSRSKARKHLSRAVDLVPDYPENRLCLIEGLLKWSDRTGARRELGQLQALWPRAKTNLTGEAWAPSWADWEQRLDTLKHELEDGPKPLRTPREGS